MSLVPVLATLLVAFAARNVLVGLFTGVLVGVGLIADSTLIMFVPDLVKNYLVPQVADSYNASVLVLLAFIGGFVKLIEFSGGGMAFARTASRWVAGPVRAQLGAWFGGIMIFFSDLGTPLIVGPVFQPLTQRLRISGQKLAFILDSTSSPVAILIPFIGWGVFIMSVIADAFAINNVTTSEWDAFVAAIPYQFYAWLAIFMVPVVVLLRADFGPMAAAEKEAGNAATSTDASIADTDTKARPILVWLPLLVLGATLFVTLGKLGFPFTQVAGADFRAALAAAYFLAAVTLVILITATGVKGILDTFTKYIEGMTSMMSIAATLVLAWALGSVSEALGTAVFVADLARDGLSSEFLPAITFMLAAMISFATGSSWGTIIIMMPLAIPAALATGSPLPIAIAAVLSGGLFGDHSSPVSETTILSSTGAGTTPLAHFRTQFPYALLNGAIAFSGFLLAGFHALLWLVPLAVASQIAVVWFIHTLLVDRGGDRA
ncbi:MAG: Na+/H+ antiporter NhaC family protein [Woeseia sp.]